MYVDDSMLSVNFKTSSCNIQHTYINYHEFDAKSISE